MSDGNVDIVRRTLEAWQHEDFDVWMSGCDPSIEWHTVLERLVEGPESVYRGHAGVRRLWRFYRTELESFEIEAQEIRDAGDDRVVLLGKFRWRGTSSGIASESSLGMVVTVQNGKIIRSVDYLSHHEALEAVGLSEKAMSHENIEDAARQIADGISSRDIGALRAISDPEIEYTSRFTAIEGKTYRGHAGWSDYVADLEAAWQDFTVTIEEFGPMGPQKLVAVIRISALARGSGVPIDQRAYAAWEFRHGKAVRGQTFVSREEALTAVGLTD